MVNMESGVLDIINTITRDVEEVNIVLKEKDSVREEIIRLSREIIRLSSSLISNVHANNHENARLDLARIKDFVNKLLDLIENHHDLKYTGLTYNALSEFVEAHLFYSIVVEGRVPTINELKVPIVPYLQGLGDLIGELRRLVVRLLDNLRIDEAEKYLTIMEAIYGCLRVLDYPDPLIPGVRHKVDVASRLIEDTHVLVLNTKNSIRCIERSGQRPQETRLC